MNDIQTKLDYADGIADWFLEMAEPLSCDDLEERTKWTYIAATILSKQNRVLSSAKLESSFLFVANCITERNSPRIVTTHKNGQKKVCLHVLNEAIPAGGHTAMAIRWIRNDLYERVHSVALLSQERHIPDDLLQAVSDAGGNIFTANPTNSFIKRATWLRSLANDLATYVILHIHMTDVICGVAFGTGGGAPVLLVNHAAHTFWTGASIADLVVNCRGSALEGLWTSTYRGIPRGVTVPIPLPEPDPLTSGGASSFELKHQAKKAIGIPTDSVVFLTVGANYKYLPFDDLDFIEVWENILKQLPEAYLIAIGFDANDRCTKTSRRIGYRIRALGTVSQSRLAIIHEATDVYIEGFPFGTTTALLEAGLKGLPVVLAPAQCPPPYGSDGVALDDSLERSRTFEEYKTKIFQLSKDPAERKFHGDKLRKAIIRHHTGSGWKQYLEDAIRTLPHEHSTYPYITPIRTPEAAHEYWSKFILKWTSGYEETLEHAVVYALSLGLRPRLTKGVLQTCIVQRSLRKHRTISLPLLVFLCNFLVPVLPITWARKAFRFLFFLCRASLIQRVHSKVLTLFGKNSGARY